MTAGAPPTGPVVPGRGDVLVLRALGLGDALTGVAPLRGVRRAWPDRRLVLAAPPGLGHWLVRLGVVDAVLPTEGLRPAWLGAAGGRDGGHVAVNLHGRGPQSHRLLQATRPARQVAFGCPEAGHDGPSWRQDEHEVTRWCRLVRTAGGACGPEDLRLPPRGQRGPLVVLHPGAASPARRWPVGRWTQLGRRLVQEGHPVVLTGSAAEEERCAAVVREVPQARSAAGRLGLDGLADLVGTARLVVCGDTGVAHLATALGTPSVLLFGPTPPSWWGPVVDPELHTVLWHGQGAGDPHADRVDPALDAIATHEVWTAVTGQLGRPRLTRCG